MPQLIEIAKPGTFTDLHGRRVELTAADLAECAKSYDPELHEAPVVVGHPKHNSPAFGWAKSLEFGADQVLRAAVEQVPTEFSEAVEAGHWKKRSPSFYLAGHPSNPKPGGLYLRHIGFLGGQAPAIKGLKDVAFFSEDEAEDPSQLLTVEFAGGDIWAARTIRSIRDWILAKFGEEDAERAVPAWAADEAQEAAAIERSKVVPAASFAETTETEQTSEGGTSEGGSSTPTETTPDGKAVNPPRGESPGVDSTTPKTPSEPTPDPLADREAELKRREQELTYRAAALDAQLERQTRAEHMAFCEGVVAQGRALPVEAARLVTFMMHLGQAEQTLDFGEGDELPPLQFFKGVLSALPRTVEFSELAPPGAEVDPITDPEAMAREIGQLQSDASFRGEYLSASDAMSKLKESHRV